MNFVKMILSRLSKSEHQTSKGAAVAMRNRILNFDDLMMKRDYIGARTLLEFAPNTLKNELVSQQWRTFCNFHLGNYKDALTEYQRLKDLNDSTLDNNALTINIAICMFYLGMYTESQETIDTIKNHPLKMRLLFHLAHKLNDEDRLLELHGTLRNTIEDQLSLASMHYLRAHYQDAIDIYKRILLEKKDYIALNIYLGLCYYKLDYYDISQEVLDLYLVKYPDSIEAINLKACNRFRLVNGRGAENELNSLIRSNGMFGADLIMHNLVVFRNGEGALHTLPKLVDVIPEARLNLSIYYLRSGDVNKAQELTQMILKPTIPSEYILKGAVHTLLAQKLDSKEHMKNAQQYFHLVGGSASECDTIPGRQSMASAFFLYGQFEEVLVYLNSIRSFFINDDVFNYNYAQAKAATGSYKEAEELFKRNSNPLIRERNSFNMIFTKCLILCGHAEEAWELYMTKSYNTKDGMLILQLIAIECYRVGEYWVSAKAFDMLEKFSLEPNPEYWEGKRGACVGAFYSVITGRTVGIPSNGFMDICALLRESTNPQVESIIRTIRNFSNDLT